MCINFTLRRAINNHYDLTMTSKNKRSSTKLELDVGFDETEPRICFHGNTVSTINEMTDKNLRARSLFIMPTVFQINCACLSCNPYLGRTLASAMRFSADAVCIVSGCVHSYTAFWARKVRSRCYKLISARVSIWWLRVTILSCDLVRTENCINITNILYYIYIVRCASVPFIRDIQI